MVLVLRASNSGIYFLIANLKTLDNDSFPGYT